MNATNIQPYSRAVVKLLKGIVEKDDVVWNDVLDLSRLEAKMMKFQIQDYDAVALCNDCLLYTSDAADE